MKGETIQATGQRKLTRRQKFLNEMQQVVPWSGLVGLIQPYYPKATGGWRPYPLEMMLRIHFMQQWFNLSDPAMEEALYDSSSMRQFAGLSLQYDSVPDETTILNFRHLLQQHHLVQQIFDQVNGMLQARGLMMRVGTIVDATILNAPSSTQNAKGARDPDMHSTF